MVPRRNCPQVTAGEPSWISSAIWGIEKILNATWLESDPKRSCPEQEGAISNASEKPISTSGAHSAREFNLRLKEKARRPLEAPLHRRRGPERNSIAPNWKWASTMEQVG